MGGIPIERRVLPPLKILGGRVLILACHVGYPDARVLVYQHLWLLLLGLALPFIHKLRY